jgi:hypothetical protein
MARMTAKEVAEQMIVIPDFILSKIAEIIKSYDKEAPAAEGSAFKHFPKCGPLTFQMHINLYAALFTIRL